ncbi:RRM domain-containing protein [Citrus sinensis]|uniref:RRM domain-containing protein n=1 Tax=Citrus sinensis TaxID=2711 RepID=A0ACB8LLP3_CITSI|nr:RRM domain-containing protein [Citrus sinensis]
MGSVDDRTFKVNFSADGVAKLRDRVKDKLKEFMGDYTDDTLVEYVIVLLRNGRRKEEARNELNVFLGDDSTSFVSWLWDHLDSNLNLYVQPEESQRHEASEIKPTLGDHAGKIDSSLLDSESERGKSNKLSRSRHNREWKGLVRDLDEPPPPLRRFEAENTHFEEKTHRIVTRARDSPSPPRQKFQKKRSRHEERQHSKREVGQSTIDAPRRLLQFAVRDAVGTTRPSNSGKEPSLKRLRSVVSTSTGDSEVAERRRRIRSVATVPNPLATVIKAVAEAAEDVKRIKSGGSVFDRLGRGMDVSDMADEPPEFGEAVVEDDEYGSFSRIQEQTGSAYYDRCDYSRQHDGNMTMLENEPALAFDSMSDNEGYDDINVTGHRVTDVCQSGSSDASKGDFMMMHYNVAKNADYEMQLTQNKDQDQPVAVVSASHKMVKISANVNTWKPHQELRVPEADGRKSIQEIEARNGKPGLQLMKENSNLVTVGNGNVRCSYSCSHCKAKPTVRIHKESEKALPSVSGLYTAGRPQEDADSRTIFISNVLAYTPDLVHFAATKDSLSRHFNKFGEVLKVVIVTDAATGQPKGSAYVEFMRKEAADNALSLDGTSFMSRILKVVKRSAAHQDTAPLMTWGRGARGSPYTAARFTRAPFPRGIHGAFRPHLPIKPGARSLQWKRDAQASPSDSGAQVPGNSVPSPTARSLTYIRPELKTDGSSGHLPELKRGEKSLKMCGAWEWMVMRISIFWFLW